MNIQEQKTMAVLLSMDANVLDTGDTILFSAQDPDDDSSCHCYLRGEHPLKANDIAVIRRTNEPVSPDSVWCFWELVDKEGEDYGRTE